MVILTPQQMREIEQIAEKEFGLKSKILIERAASAILGVLEEDYENPEALKIYFLVGPGNNGKDAQELSKMLGMTKKRTTLESCDIIIDGLYGTGLNRDITGAEAENIEKINKSGKRVYSIDIPSGVNGLTGNVLGKAIKAFKTITFFGKKPGMMFGEGKDCAGIVSVHDLGIPMSEKIAAQISIKETSLNKKILQRDTNSHKGTFGRVLCIAGSNGMRGAAALCAMGAYAAGTGLVFVATTERIWNSVSVVVPEAIGLIMDESDEGGISSKNTKELISAAKAVDAVIVGPGMMNSVDTCKIVKRLMREVKTPIILDADALNSIEMRDISREVIITPHLVEMEGLSEVPKEKILSDRIQFTSDFAKKNKCITLLKGAGTIVSSPNGEISINTTGNAGMAVAGSGDVLSGIIAALLAQGLTSYEAACGGAFLHGMAGDLAAKEKGMLSLLSSDIVKCISKACLILEAGTNE